jgi:hypothetical protein
MFPANTRTLLLPPSGCGVLLGDGTFRLPVVGKARHRAAIDRLSAGMQLRCAALLSRDGRDYDREGVMVTIREEEVGFLPWMDSRDLRIRLRNAGFLEAVCKAEIGSDHILSDEWDYVGVKIDASFPFALISPEEWHKQHAPNDAQENRIAANDTNGQILASTMRVFQRSLIERIALRVPPKIDWSQSLSPRAFWARRFKNDRSSKRDVGNGNVETQRRANRPRRKRPTTS